MDKILQELLITIDGNPSDLSNLQNAIQSFFDKNQDHNFQVSEMARMLFMSERNLRRKFQTLFGKNPAKIIAIYRIEKAKKLLENETSVSDVAYQLKFSSTSHFSKVFKALVGLTPSDYEIGRSECS